MTTASKDRFTIVVRNGMQERFVRSDDDLDRAWRWAFMRMEKTGNTYWVRDSGQADRVRLVIPGEVEL